MSIDLSLSLSAVMYSPLTAARLSSRLARALAAAAVLLVLVAMPAQAQTGWPLTNEPLGPVEPDIQRAEAYRSAMAAGDMAAGAAVQLRAELRGQVQLRDQVADYRQVALRAVDAYERAARARPAMGEPHYRAAEVINRHFLAEPQLLTDREIAGRAIEHWRQFDLLAPLDPRTRYTLFGRALVHTKLATEPDFNDAIAIYETLLARSDLDSADADNAATWLGNLAETYMMVGRLEDAIATYRRALGLQNRALYAFGLAVALDRYENGIEAREIMAAYAQGGGLRELSSDSIFFVPDGELHAYLALGAESMGELEAAEQHYRMFIASGAHPRYQPRARENLRLVEARRRALGQSRRERAP